MKRFRNILVGLDAADGSWTEGSLSAARQASWLAERTGAKLQFLHSTFRNEEDEAAPEWPEAEMERELQSALRRIGQGAPTPELICTTERPWLAIIRRVLAGENDLVVVAKRNRSSHGFAKLGSVSIKLIRKCPCPVWVVKPDHPLQHGSILAATDLSAVGDEATEYGAFLAQAENCDLHIVHAWQVPLELQLSASRLGSEETTRLKGEIAQRALRHIQSVPQVAALGDRAKFSVTCNAPSRAILQLAKDQGPDLAVLGTISRGGIAGVLVGNTAERVLDRLDCSLLAVKPVDFVCPVQLETEAPASGSTTVVRG